MNLIQSKLYNKFHILSVGLRRIERLISENKLTEAKETLNQLTKESDSGIEYIKEVNSGWTGG